MANTAETEVTTAYTSRVADPVPLLAPLLEHVRDGVIFVGDDMRVRFLNAVARRDMSLHWHGASDLLGQSVWDALEYSSDFPARIAVEQAGRDRMPAYFSTRSTRADAWVETDVIPIDGGILLYYRDVTPRSTAETARAVSEHQLQMTSERLRVLIDEAPLPIYALDNEGRVQHWNPEAEAIFQWTSAEVLGRRLPTVPDEERDSFQAIMSGPPDTQSVRAVPARRRRRDGVMLDVQISASPMRDENGEVTGKIIMVTDVTQNKKLEMQLRMAQKMEAVGLLAGGVAHDFNNLLTAIKGFSSLLLLHLPRDVESAELLGEINKAADRAAALTAQLLAFSRRQLLRPEPLDLNARVRELERMLQVILREGELVLDLRQGLSKVLVDPGQIEQVIMNLIVNARDAIRGRAGASVTITTSNAELTHQFAQWGVEEAPGDYVRLEVKDNGMGMDRATLARIFDPFFTTKAAGHGTGLGLATVFGIVKQSGGYVWADSTPDVGSTFTVYLPRAHSPGRASGPVSVRRSAGTERILLVEDEQLVRRVARRALELQGYTVIEAPDGLAALELAAQHEIDLLVTDVMMPVMLGPMLAGRLRERFPKLRVLFMSGHSDEIVRDGLLDPATPFIGKPFTPAQLAEKVRECLDSGLG